MRKYGTRVGNRRSATRSTPAKDSDADNDRFSQTAELGKRKSAGNLVKNGGSNKKAKDTNVPDKEDSPRSTRATRGSSKLGLPKGETSMNGKTPPSPVRNTKDSDSKSAKSPKPKKEKEAKKEAKTSKFDSHSTKDNEISKVQDVIDTDTANGARSGKPEKHTPSTMTLTKVTPVVAEPDSDSEELCESSDSDSVLELSGDDSDLDSDDEDAVTMDSESDSSIEELDDDSEDEVTFTQTPKTSNTLEAALLVLQQDYEQKLKAKDEEIQRLKHDLTWKTDQLMELNDLSVKNMELESKLSHILADSKVYEEEVKKFKTAHESKKKEESSNTTKAECSKTEAEMSKDKSKKEGEGGKDEEKDTRKRRSTARKEVVIDLIDIAETPRKKRRGEKEEVEGKKKRRRGKKEEEKGEDIDALFVSDDDDDVIEITKPKEDDKKDTKKESKQEKKEATKNDDQESKDREKDKEEGDEDDDDNDDKHKGRKDIRKLMSTKKLAEETVQAAKEEKERRERVAKLKELHIRVDEKVQKNRAPVTSKLVLATKNNDMKTPLVQVNSKLIRKLKPHQVDAVEFMWDSMIESMDTFKEKKDREHGNGCILAHCMGLGKTLSVIAFVHTLLTHKCIGFKTCLVVAPLNTVLNWQNEFNKWLDKKDRLKVYELISCKDNSQRAERLQEWRKTGGVIIMGYQIFRILVTLNTRSKKKKQIFEQCLQDPGPDMVVCDEGHMLKNDVSQIAKCMNKVKTRRRVVLTGTPLQNNLIEYHCMVNFVKPNLLGTRREFGNRFVNPITNGQHADSTQYDVKLMKRRAHVLHEMLSGCVQRRDYSALVKYLPPKEEYIISVRLSPLQMDLYKKYLERLICPTDPTKPLAGASLFADYQQLMRVWTHPWVLRMNEIREEKRAQFDEDDDDELGSLLNSESEDETTTTTSTASSDNEDTRKSKSGKEKAAGQSKKSENKKDENSDEKSDVVQVATRRSGRGYIKKNESSASLNGKKNLDANDKSRKKDEGIPAEEVDPKARKSKLIAGEVIKQWKSSYRRKEDDGDDEIAQRKKEEQWWASMLSEEEHKKSLELSGKLVLMFEILRMAQTFGDKVLVFSQSLLSLDLIEDFLAYKNEEYEEAKAKKGSKKKSTLSSWTKDEDYVRMDGSTTANSRKRLTEDFNDTKNTRLRLFLISTRAGGLGINLDIANRVIIFDASWNPSHDIQSIFRVYRFGQEKPVYVYRFLAQGTMEEKIYERQVTKETLSQRVIDENQIDRHFTASDLQELYIFKPARLDDPEEKNRPTPKLPKDLILTELLANQKDWIVGYHEHDSLLERRPEEDLSEDERKKAWEEYERDKQGLQGLYRTVAPVFNTNPMYNTNMFGNRPLLSNVQYPMYRPIQPAPMLLPGLNMANVNPVRAPAPSSTGGNPLGFQISQLPRVVQEILKYNPNISPVELQNRLQAFLGMHAKYTVPGLALAGAAAAQPMTTTAGTSLIQSLIGNPPVASTAAIPLMPFIFPQPGPSVPISSTSTQQSRLPLPGKLPATNQ